jgi:hypothetical protein
MRPGQQRPGVGARAGLGHFISASSVALPATLGPCWGSDHKAARSRATVTGRLAGGGDALDVGGLWLARLLRLKQMMAHRCK